MRQTRLLTRHPTQLRISSAGRTNIVLDSKLVDRVKRLANVTTARDAKGYDPKKASPLRRCQVLVDSAVWIASLRGDNLLGSWAGVRPRSANDCLMAMYAMLGGMPLLHHDRNFGWIAVGKST